MKDLAIFPIFALTLAVGAAVVSYAAPNLTIPFAAAAVVCAILSLREG